MAYFIVLPHNKLIDKTPQTYTEQAWTFMLSFSCNYSFFTENL
jgi:hypothetical protein